VVASGAKALVQEGPHCVPKEEGNLRGLTFKAEKVASPQRKTLTNCNKGKKKRDRVRINGAKIEGGLQYPANRPEPLMCRDFCRRRLGGVSKGLGWSGVGLR